MAMPAMEAAISAEIFLLLLKTISAKRFLENLHTHIANTCIELCFQNLMWTDKNWMAGRLWPAGHSLDTPALYPILL